MVRGPEHGRGSSVVARLFGPPAVMCFRLLLLLFLVACAPVPKCTEYRPAYPTELGIMRLTPAPETAALHVEVRATHGIEIDAPVHTEITSSHGEVMRFERDTFTVPVPGDSIRVRVRATGYRPADSTFQAGELVAGRLAIELPSLIVATPPLQACPPSAAQVRNQTRPVRQ